MLIERAAFERLGGFDPGFFMFYEDIDLCLRANEAGYPTIVEPNWSVRHARRHSTDERFGRGTHLVVRVGRAASMPSTVHRFGPTVPT